MAKNTNNSTVRTKEEYLNSMHRLGRLGAILACCVMLAMPTIISIVYGTFPGFVPIFAGSIGLLALFLPTAISEVISFTPILGSSIYLTLLTGNVMNLKLPVATNALSLLDIDNGSEDADVVSAIAVSISSITTVTIIALGVLLMVPLKPVLTLPAVETASKYILPSLFGCMALNIFSDGIGGGVSAKRRMLGAVVPAIIVTIAYFILGSTVLSMFQGFLIIILLPITYFGTKFLYKKGVIKVFLPGEKPGTKKEEPVE